MFAAGPTAQCITAAAALAGRLLAARALAVLALSHTAEVDHRRAGGPVGAGHSGHRGRIHGASLAVRGKPQSADGTASLQHIGQCGCTQTNIISHSPVADLTAGIPSLTRTPSPSQPATDRASEKPGHFYFHDNFDNNYVGRFSYNISL